MTAKQLQQELDEAGNAHDARFLQRFFKTGPGQYGEGDIFIGVRVPVTRKIAAGYRTLTLKEIERLLESPVHEHRLAAVIIMAEESKRADEPLKKALYDLYLKRSDRINNWDIVDVSCPAVVGSYLIDKPKNVLYALARSDSIWERRIAIISTMSFIKQGELHDTFAIAELLLQDTHDLIHKAAGWMLREAGQKNEKALRSFLDKHTPVMPRTMLRYAIEKFTPKDRQQYLQLR